MLTKINCNWYRSKKEQNIDYSEFDSMQVSHNGATAEHTTEVVLIRNSGKSGDRYFVIILDNFSLRITKL